MKELDNRQWQLIRRPTGMPSEAHLQCCRVEVPELRDGDMLIKNHYISIDPAMRNWISQDPPPYMPLVKPGDPVPALTIGQVMASRHDAFVEGQWVRGMNAMEEWTVRAGGPGVFKIDPASVESPTHFLSVLGSAGLTAYFGLLEVGKPQPGETILVTGAAGGVGSLVGQIARIKGFRAVGVAGGAEKCRRLIDDYGYAGAIDYRGLDLDGLSLAIKRHCPDGLDVVFENVGGDILEAALLNLKRGARIALCGMISEYNSDSGPVGVRNLWQLVMKDASIHGFIAGRFADRFEHARQELAAWLRDGLLRVDEHVENGIENALLAFQRLFDGTNTGKMILRLA